MKIVGLYSENFKRLRVVDIFPEDEPVIKITGANGSGKTSVLDAILAALGGVDSLPAYPVRKGESWAEVRLDLGEVLVTRHFSGIHGSELVIEAKNGTKIKQPQTWINSLLDKVSFDPLAFSRRTPREQAEQLRKLVELSVDPDEIDRANKADYDARRKIKSDADALKARIDAMPTVPAGVPLEPVDEQALVVALEAAGNTNGQREAAILQQRMYIQRAEQAANNTARIAEEIVGLEARIVQLRLDQEKASADAVLLRRKAESTEIPEMIDTSMLTAEVNQARRDNRWIEQRKVAADMEAERSVLEMQAVSLTEAMRSRDDIKRRAIAEAKMPIEGLGFEDGLVMYQGLPFDQASGAEQLRVSMAIAMAGNPKLRIIRIVDGSLLDDVTMEMVTQMARDKDFQVWIEMVDTSGKVGIVMSDGVVESTPSTRNKRTARLAKSADAVAAEQ